MTFSQIKSGFSQIETFRFVPELTLDPGAPGAPGVPDSPEAP